MTNGDASSASATRRRLFFYFRFFRACALHSTRAGARKMATVNPLEDILNSDLDPNEINALVGSLESQLASPTIKDSAQSHPVSAVSRNHVHTQAVVSHGNLSDKRTLQITNAPAKIAPQHGSNTNPLTNVNGGNTIVTSQQLLTLSNRVTSPASVSSASSGLLTSSNNLQSQSPKTVMTIPTSSLNSNFTPTSNLVVASESLQGKQVTASIVGTGSEQLLLRTSQNGGVVNRVQTVNAVASTVSATAVGNSAIHKLATVAAEQKPLTVTTVNHTAGLMDQKPVVNTQGNIAPRPPQILIKNEPGPRPIAQPVMAQPISSSSPHVTAALKSSSASSNVITINNPNTVTVVRPTYPAASSQSTTQHAQPQIQIVNVPNSGINPRLQGVSTNPKTLAARMVQQQPVRIAPQQLQAPQVTVTAQPAATAQPRPQGQGNVVCDLYFHLLFVFHFDVLLSSV